MNKLVQIKLKKQIGEMRKSTESCAEFLTAFTNNLDFPNGVVAAELNKVLQHQKNMVKFFGILEDQIAKK